MALYSTLQKFITKEGAPVEGASVNVKLSGGAVDAELFATRTGTAKNNPFLTTSNGEALCYVKAGRYDMTVTKGTDQIVFKDIEVGPVSNVGTFADGGTITDPDQLVEDADGNKWRWTGNLNYTFEAAENPNSIAEWVRYIDLGLPPFKTVAAMKSHSNLKYFSGGTRVEWQGYYDQSDGGGNWGVLRFGSHTEDGGSIFSIDANTYIVANLSGAINIKKFGAKGDGVTDDTTAIQAALDKKGAVTFGKNRVYKVSGLTIYSDMVIDLNGSTLERNMDAWPGSQGGDREEFIIYTNTPLSNVVIKNGITNDFHLAGNDDRVRSFFGARDGGTITDFKFLNLTFLDSRSGIYCNSAFGAGYAASNVLVQDCKAYGVQGNPPTFPTKWNYVLGYFTTARNVTVDRCRSEYTYHLCIFDRDYANEGFPSVDNTVSNSSCWESFDTGVYSYAKRTLFTGNVITRPGKDGLKINSTPDAESGDSIVTCNRVIGTGGHYRADSSYGIVSSGRGNIVSDNVIVVSSLGAYAGGGYAIVTVDSNTTISNNTISITEGSNSYGGVTLSYNPAVSQSGTNKYSIVTGNNIHGSVGIAVGIASPDNVSHYTISNNMLHAYTSAIYHNNDPLGYYKPLFSTITGNVFVGGGYNDLVSIRSASQVVFSNNTMSGSRRRDMQSSAYLLGEGNTSDHGGDPSVSIDFRCFRRGVYRATTPTAGTFYVSQIVSNGTKGAICTESGTGEAISITADTIASSKSITVSDASMLSQGMVLDIAGEVTPFVINEVNGTSILLHAEVTNTGTGTVVTNHPPTWSEFAPSYA